jgi:tRNA(Glu) U13 pseudouridine synthase TruD
MTPQLIIQIQKRSRFTRRVVIRPLIGKNVTLPSHQTGEFIKSLLLERGLSLETINRVEKSGVKSRVRGHYRRVIEFPAEFSYRLVNYSDPNETIQLTEINTLNLQQQPEESHGAKNSNPSKATRLGLVIEFNLSAGSYATMLLRELMKEATDSSYHAELTAASAAVTAAASSASSTRGEKRKESEIEESVTVGSGAEPEGVASKRVKESGGNGAVTGEEAS